MGVFSTDNMSTEGKVGVWVIWSITFLIFSLIVACTIGSFAPKVMTDPYVDGFRAQIEGKDVSDCPYSNSGGHIEMDRYHKWLRGWQTAASRPAPGKGVIHESPGVVSETGKLD